MSSGTNSSFAMSYKQIAIEQQIKRLERENPDKRVGIVAFNNEVLIIGDGTQDPVVIAGDRLGSWEGLFF